MPILAAVLATASLIAAAGWWWSTSALRAERVARRLDQLAMTRHTGPYPDPAACVLAEAALVVDTELAYITAHRTDTGDNDDA